MAAGTQQEPRGNLGSEQPAPDERSWPPAWFAIAEGEADDASEQVEEVLAAELKRHGA